MMAVLKDTFAFARGAEDPMALYINTFMQAQYMDSPGCTWEDALGDRGESVVKLFESHEFPKSYESTSRLLSWDPAITVGPAMCARPRDHCACRRACCRCAPGHCLCALHCMAVLSPDPPADTRCAWEICVLPPSCTPSTWSSSMPGFRRRTPFRPHWHAFTCHVACSASKPTCAGKWWTRQVAASPAGLDCSLTRPQTTTLIVTLVVCARPQ